MTLKLVFLPQSDFIKFELPKKTPPTVLFTSMTLYFYNTSSTLGPLYTVLDS